MATNYHEKYLKYKTKYMELKNELDLKNENDTMSSQVGGMKPTRGFTYVNSKEKENKIKKMKTTKSFIPKLKLTDRMRTFFVHDNGDRPYRITANKKGIDIHRIMNFDYDDSSKDEYELELHLNKFRGFWYGFDSEFCCKYEAHGNTILIQLTKTKYMYISAEIYTFESDEEILDFISPLGNNDVPYPVAYSANRVYFMLDKVYINKSELETEATVANAGTMYGEFYGWVGSKKKCKKSYNCVGTHTKHKMSKVKILRKFRQ